MDRSSILRASTIYDQGEPFHEGFAFFVAPSWGDTMTSRKEAGAFREQGHGFPGQALPRGARFGPAFTREKARTSGRPAITNSC